MSTTASPAISMAPPAVTSKGPSKSQKQKLIVKLQMSSDNLNKFTPPDQAARKASRSKSGSSTTSSSTAQPAEPSPPTQPATSTPTPATNGTTTDSNNSLAPPPVAGVKRKGIPGPKPGSKRGPALGPDGLPKPRGKPGPKKKPRIGELNADGTKTTFGGVAPIKLGPKANQGAINAGLRALDRSGKPCRKWERKGFQLKSFTGVVWTVPTWRAPKKKPAVDANGDVKSDTTGSSDTKVNESALPSDKSNSGDLGTATPIPAINIASSPAPATVEA